jgi:hypothetical protein
MTQICLKPGCDEGVRDDESYCEIHKEVINNDR